MPLQDARGFCTVDRALKAAGRIEINLHQLGLSLERRNFRQTRLKSGLDPVVPLLQILLSYLRFAGILNFRISQNTHFCLRKFLQDGAFVSLRHDPNDIRFFDIVCGKLTGALVLHSYHALVPEELSGDWCQSSSLAVQLFGRQTNLARGSKSDTVGPNLRFELTTKSLG